MRAAVCVWLAIAAAAGGCDSRAPGTAAREQEAAFVARCEALPHAPVEVVPIPIRVTRDETRPHAELTGMYERARADHATMGLTQTNVGYETAVRLSGLKDASGRRTCLRAAIRVSLSMRPLTVFVARELADDECRRDAVREHEAKHVAVYEAHLRESAARLAVALPQAFGGRLVHAASVADGQAEIEAELARFLDDFIAGEAQRLAERQSAVDSPAEYARVAAACTAAR
ncbi:MAG: hypothetical protein U1F15_07525 [Burkholderiales bacterium]